MSNDYDDDDYDVTHLQGSDSIFDDMDDDGRDMYDHDQEIRLEHLENEIAKLEELIIRASMDDALPHTIERLEDELDLLTMDYNGFRS